MKILMLSALTGMWGAARATQRLYEGISKSNIDIQLLTAQSEKFASMWYELDRLPLQYYRKRKNIYFSPAWVPTGTLSRIQMFNPDIVHLNWINHGFISIEAIGRIQKPIVWTLHDSWPFTGGCHVPFDCKRYNDKCGHCPVLRSNNDRDLSYHILHRKKTHWRDLNITFVAPSRWLAGCLQSSSLFQNRDVRVIPNGLDLNTFKATIKESARKKLFLSENKKIIAFGALNPIQDANKGYNYLLQIEDFLLRKQFGNEYQIVIFGSNEPNNKSSLITSLGTLKDDKSLALLYSAADIVVVPSFQESFCQVAAESMACGTPVLAFGATGLLDIVEHQVNGYLAKPYELDDLIAGIFWILDDKSRYEQLSIRAREKVEKCYSLEVVSKSYSQLYNEISKL